MSVTTFPFGSLSDGTAVTAARIENASGASVTANGLRAQSGHGGAPMGARQALCFETQLWPNALRCYGFPSPVLRREQHLHSETVYAFSLA